MVEQSCGQAVLSRALAIFGLAMLMALAGEAAFAQQYQNFEVTPNRRGGAQGTLGNRNFQVDPDYSRPVQRRNNATATQHRRNATPQRFCVVDAQGRVRCK